MIPALIHGKLSRDQQNMEDLLTSCVFGMLQCASAQDGLERWLRYANCIVGSTGESLPSPLLDVRYTFWPWLQVDGSPGAEPDVLLSFTDATGRQHLILVEAKYQSGKSSYEDLELPHPSDQLAREWHCLVADLPEHVTAHMVYLTADFGPPSTDIHESASEFERKCPSLAAKHPFQCHWLSWRHLVPAFESSPSPMLHQLSTLAIRLDLKFFSGVRPLRVAPDLAWRFEQSVVAYQVPALHAGLPSWRFMP